MAFPQYTKIFHNFSYPAIEPSRPELSTAGKVVFITGGGSGIGPRIAHAFAKSGAAKIIIMGRTESSLLSTKNEVETEFPKSSVLTFVADIVDQKAVNMAFETAKKAVGPVDILIQNAGYLPDVEPLATANIDEFMRGFDINVKGNLIVSQAFLANSSENSILVHVSTGGAHAPALHPGLGSYGTSKLAAAKMIDYIAAGNPQLRTVNVHPGVLDTKMNKKSVKGGLVLPFDDVELAASFMVWISSPEAAFLKGKFVWSNWDVDELISKKEELLSTPALTLGLIGI